jgi:hypothetical protein
MYNVINIYLNAICLAWKKGVTKKMGFISEEKLLKVLMGFNPWWITGKVPKEFTKPFKRTAFYETKKKLSNEQLRRIVLLSGARRVGKTTIMYQLIEDLLSSGIVPKHILYVSFDHPLLKFCEIDEIIKVFVDNISGEDRKIYLFFDEIQYADNWDKWLKVLYDLNPLYKIIATGSASPVISSKSAESGVGRWIEVKIPTLSFYEYIQLIGVEDIPVLSEQINPIDLAGVDKQDIASLLISLRNLQKHLQRYLLVGGFPEIALADDIPYAQRIMREDIVDKVLKRDMTALFKIRNVAELEKIFLYLCIHSSQIISIESIAKEIRVSRTTVANYLELLKQSNLIYISNPAEIGGKKVLKSRPKIFLADAAIRNAVLMLEDDILTNPDEMGIIVETTVFKHIASFYYDKLPKIGYYRENRTSKEVDIVVSLPSGKILIETKYRENPDITEKEAIVALANDPNVKNAVVVTKSEEDYGVLPYKTKTPVIKIPAYAFLYLLGRAEKERVMPLSLP